MMKSLIVVSCCLVSAFVLYFFYGEYQNYRRHRALDFMATWEAFCNKVANDGPTELERTKADRLLMEDYARLCLKRLTDGGNDLPPKWAFK